MRVLTLVLAGVVGIVSGLTAQDLERAREFLIRGDTNQAASIYERILAKDRRNAEAHFQLGMIHFRRFVPGTNVSRDRRIAERHLRLATRLSPDSARYALELGKLFHTYGVTTTEIQVGPLYNRARKLAGRTGGPVAAEAEYMAALWDWKQYEQLAHRYLFRGGTFAIDFANTMSEWRYVKDFFSRQVIPDPGSPGRMDLLESEDHLKAALEYQPDHLRAAALLVVALGEEDRWDEALEVSQKVLRSAPERGAAWALRAMVQTRTNQWAAAQAGYMKALSLMTPGERAPYDNLGLLLKSVDSLNFEKLTDRSREDLARMYWAAQQPLALTGLNETKTEFFARITYVNARWSDSLRGYSGYESDRGAVYVRYGPPDIWATLGTGRDSRGDVLENGANTVVWIYEPSRLRYIFSLTPGYNKAVFPADLRTFYTELQNTYPARFDNVPVVREIDTVEVQYVQFRGKNGKTDVAAYSFIPVGRMVKGAANMELPLETGAIVRNKRLQDLAKRTARETVVGHDTAQMELRSWRFRLPPSEYLMRIEGLIAPLESAARSSSILRVRDYDVDTLALSDLLVARKIEPTDSDFTRWSDFLVLPSAGTFRPGEPVGLLWELYNLEPDGKGKVHYRVKLEMRVVSVERSTVGATIIGALGDALGLSAKGSLGASLEYDRVATAGPDGVNVDYVSVDLSGPPGYYDIDVLITDLRTGQRNTISRRIRVTRRQPGVR